MQLVYNNFFDVYKNVLDNYKKGIGNGIRWIIPIDKDNIDLVKIFLESGTRIKHIKNMPMMNFAVGNREANATIEKMEGGIRAFLQVMNRCMSSILNLFLKNYRRLELILTRE
jgi:hypothetical protein